MSQAVKIAIIGGVAIGAYFLFNAKSPDPYQAPHPEIPKVTTGIVPPIASVRDYNAYVLPKVQGDLKKPLFTTMPAPTKQSSFFTPSWVPGNFSNSMGLPPGVVNFF